MSEHSSADLTSLQLPINSAQGLPDDKNLTPAEQTEVLNIIKGIDVYDPLYSLSYGTQTMHSIAGFSDSLMAQVRAKDAGAIGEQLTGLMLKIKQVDVSVFKQKPGLLAAIPVVGSFFNRIERTMLEYQTLAQQVEKITQKLNDAMVELLRNVSVLEVLFTRNREVFQQITLHVIAGKQKLEQLRQQELPALQAKAGDDPLSAQQVRDLLEGAQRFERRLHDLMLSRTIAMQTAPQIRLMQSNSQSLAEKIQSSILSTIPVWKSQIALAIKCLPYMPMTTKKISPCSMSSLTRWSG